MLPDPPQGASFLTAAIVTARLDKLASPSGLRHLTLQHSYREVNCPHGICSSTDDVPFYW